MIYKQIFYYSDQYHSYFINRFVLDGWQNEELLFPVIMYDLADEIWATKIDNYFTRKGGKRTLRPAIARKNKCWVCGLIFNDYPPGGDVIKNEMYNKYCSWCLTEKIDKRKKELNLNEGPYDSYYKPCEKKTTYKYDENGFIIGWIIFNKFGDRLKEVDLPAKTFKEKYEAPPGD